MFEWIKKERQQNLNQNKKNNNRRIIISFLVRQRNRRQTEKSIYSLINLLWNIEPNHTEMLLYFFSIRILSMYHTAKQKAKQEQH